ncbi:EamA family transporter [Dyadobacter subterraneus]|nr:EamA family transporter [Dyadobacter subterraneus]
MKLNYTNYSKITALAWDQLSLGKRIIELILWGLTRENMWKYYAVLSAIFAALTAILAKIGIKGMNGNVATAVRTVVVVFIAWGIILASGEIREVKLLNRNNLIFLVLSGVATGLSWIFYFKALETGNVSKVAPIDKLSVAIAMGLAFLILKEPIDLKTLIGGLLILAGTIVIIL